MNKLYITYTLLGSLLLAGSANAQKCITDGIPATTSHLVDNNDGTVTDDKTGLMWKKCSEGQTSSDCNGSAQSYSWNDALERAQTINTTEGGFAGYTDWRIPNIKELASIIEEQCKSPTINLEVFQNAPAYSSTFWSSSPRADAGSGAWYVNFTFGYSGTTSKDSGSQIRLVRNEQ